MGLLCAQAAAVVLKLCALPRVLHEGSASQPQAPLTWQGERATEAPAGSQHTSPNKTKIKHRGDLGREALH